MKDKNITKWSGLEIWLLIIIIIFIFIFNTDIVKKNMIIRKKCIGNHMYYETNKGSIALKVNDNGLPIRCEKVLESK